MSMSTRQGPSRADLLDAAGPGRFRAGRADRAAIPLLDLTDADVVEGLIDDVCTRLATRERSAAGFSLYYGAVGAVLIPVLADLVLAGPAPAALTVTDLAGTRVGRGPDGFVASVWPRTTTLEASGQAAVAALGGWVAVTLDAVVRAFSPHLRIGPRAYASAAGSVLAHRAEPMGRLVRDVARARRLVAELARAAGPTLRAVPYIDVELAQGWVNVPRPTVCCRWYRLAGEGRFCAGCPREPEPARTEHFREYLTGTVWPALRPAAAGAPGEEPGRC